MQVYLWILLGIAIGWLTKLPFLLKWYRELKESKNYQNYRRMKELEGALFNLLCLKAHKETVGKNQWYEEQQPKAWQRASALFDNTLETYIDDYQQQHQSQPLSTGTVQ